MDEDGNEINRRLLTLSLEIISLLSGEDYTIVRKTLGDCVTPIIHLQESGGRSRSPITAPPPIHERSKKRILELSNKMIELLTGEVPIRCQDVAVFLSMEEWEYLEGHKERYEEVMMEEQRPVISHDGSRRRNPPERCPRPLCPQDCPEEKHNVPETHQGEDPANIKVEDETEEEVDERTRGDQPCKSEAEEIPAALTTENHSQNPEGTFMLMLNYKVGNEDIKQHTTEENPITLNLNSGLYSTNLLYNPLNHKEPSPAQLQIFSTSSGLKEGKGFECGECGQQFTKSSGLLTHRKFHTWKKPYCCLECGKWFTDKANLVIHERSHTGERPYSCTECGRSFTSKSSLVRHERVHTGEKPYSCTVCEKCFAHRSDLMKHQRSHTGEKPYSCSQCGKCFTDKSSLVKHLKSHTGEKPFSCLECGKCFLTKAKLRDHHRNHTGERPFSCSLCGKTFMDNSSFARHKKGHTGEKPYSCSQCEKCFTDKSSMVRHEKSHKGEKPFVCSECRKCFAHSSDLVKHFRIHTGEKPYSCSECGKCFADKSYLAKHERLHTGEKPYSCSECEKCFTHQSDLVKHQKIHRGEKPC
ncbi:uncharacterized protein ACNLHF_026357 isoform 2-T2 [Anomaloglossus baeobatrachus]|uniref:uncharacterized protein LOC142257951 isoform X2 n=1 Tax=Anomaloglossus baeobatrachus TaxID=238106 RepID=UPI003F5075DF